MKRILIKRVACLGWQAVQLLDAMWQAGGEVTPDTVSHNAALKATASALQLPIGMQACPGSNSTSCLALGPCTLAEQLLSGLVLITSWDHVGIRFKARHSFGAWGVCRCTA